MGGNIGLISGNKNMGEEFCELRIKNLRIGQLRHLRMFTQTCLAGSRLSQI